MAVLDLRHEARRNPDLAGKPAQGDAFLLARVAQARSKLVGPVGTTGAGGACGFLADCLAHAT